MNPHSKTYLIRMKSHVELNWSHWFEQVEVHFENDGHTIITGSLPDQTALFGVLMKIRDLGLSLVEVKQINNHFNTTGE